MQRKGETKMIITLKDGSKREYAEAKAVIDIAYETPIYLDGADTANFSRVSGIGYGKCKSDHGANESYSGKY